MEKVIHNKKLQQINVLDERFYTFNNVDFYPSCTEILNVYPKGFGFNQWLKDVGGNATEIVERAARFGSIIHNATELLNNNIELKWLDDNGNKNFEIEEWKAILKFTDFWRKTKPKLIANELSLCSEQLGYGGTLDRVVEINNKRYLIDIKTSNYIHKTHELQLSAYAMLWNEFNPTLLIDDIAVLWLKASIRTDKIDFDKKTVQGISDAGAWQLKFFDRHYSESFKIFQYTHAIYKEENPNCKPKNLLFSDRIKL